MADFMRLPVPSAAMTENAYAAKPRTKCMTRHRRHLWMPPYASPRKNQRVCIKPVICSAACQVNAIFLYSPRFNNNKRQEAETTFWAVSASWILRAVLLQPFLYASGIVLCSKHQNVAPLRSAVSITAVKTNSLPSLKV